MRRREPPNKSLVASPPSGRCAAVLGPWSGRRFAPPLHRPAPAGERRHDTPVVRRAAATALSFSHLMPHAACAFRPFVIRHWAPQSPLRSIQLLFSRLTGKPERSRACCGRKPELQRIELIQQGGKSGNESRLLGLEQQPDRSGKKRSVADDLSQGGIRGKVPLRSSGRCRCRNRPTWRGRRPGGCRPTRPPRPRKSRRFRKASSPPPATGAIPPPRTARAAPAARRQESQG